MDVRPADVGDVERLTEIWYQGWQDGHAQIVPAELRRLRTRENFRERLQAALSDVRVVGPPGAPVGFCIVRGDELYQLFVAPESRGSSIAATLLAEAEARLTEGGVRRAWLACAIGNARAARFYEKHGWRRVGTMMNRLETAAGIFTLEVWRFEKVLTRAAPEQ